MRHHTSTGLFLTLATTLNLTRSASPTAGACVR